MSYRIACAALAALASSIIPAHATVVASITDSKLTLRQTTSSGPIRISNDTTFGDLRITEGSTDTEFPARRSVTIELLDDSGDVLKIDLARPLIGRLRIDLGDGDRALQFIGTANVVGKDLVILAGEGIQTIDLAVNAPLLVGDDLIVSLGDDFDSIDNGDHAMTIIGDCTLERVNQFENDGLLTIGGDLTFRAEFESSPLLTNQLANHGALSVAGDLVVTTAAEPTTIELDQPTHVGGNVNIAFGAGTAANEVALHGKVRILGDVAVASLSAGPDRVTAEGTAAIGGDIAITVGDGANVLSLFGELASSSIVFVGGNDPDTVTLAANAPNAKCDVATKDGIDLLELRSIAVFDKLFVNFGGGADTFVDEIGPPYPFPVTLKNP